MSYQDRKDIDNLYFLVWDREADSLKLATKEEVEELSNRLSTLYLDESQTRQLILDILREYDLID